MQGERTQRERAQTRERGATAIEYGLLVALIAIVMIAAVSLMSSRISAVFLAAAEPFSDAQPAELAVDAKVKPGKSVTVSLAQLSGLKNVKQLKVKADVVGVVGRPRAMTTGLSRSRRRSARPERRRSPTPTPTSRARRP